MKRFLFVVPPLTGHVVPTVSVARALAARGHRVAWVCHPRRVRPLLPDDAEILPLDDHLSDDVWGRMVDRSQAVRGLDSLRFLWEEVLVPLARGMERGVARAVETFRPDAMMVDQQAVAGALAARRFGIPWLTFCTTSAGVVDALADLPKVKEWIACQLAELEAQAGLPHTGQPDLSPHGVVVFSTKALVGEDLEFPKHMHFVGPSIQDRPDATPFPWEQLAAVPRVFVSLGTVSASAGAQFYATAVAALRDLDAQIILAAPPELVPDPPPTFLVRPRVPQLALLPHVDAVVCHAGHNTVCEALANGLPLVVAPIRDDQPVVATQVVRSGAAIRVKYGRLSPSALRDAVLQVLREPAFREAARRIGASFTTAGGASAAADAVEALS
jgi:MGT family glycosyltransferase